MNTNQNDDDVVQPTCYDARNPAMPWLRADELTYEDAEDRADASTWLGEGAPATTIGGLQKRTNTTVKTSAALVTPVPDLFQLPIMQQLAHPAQLRRKRP